MATTYLTLANRVLRELNETELTSSTFSSSRGIQTAIKDFVNKGIHDIYNETGEIPLLYSRTSQDLTVGDNEYDFPTDFRKADMDSFVLKPKELVTNSLGPIVNESLSIFLKSFGKSYSLSPVTKFCVVLEYNKGISDASL